MTYQEFEKIWDGELKTKLEALESDRKQENKATIIGFLAGLISFALLLTLAIGKGFIIEDTGHFAFGLAIGTGSLVYYWLHPKKYREKYKNNIIASLVSQTKYKWSYEPYARSGTRESFLNSGLYYSSITDFHTDDSFISNVPGMSMNEINVTKGSGKSKSVVFKGVMFCFPISRKFLGETYLRAGKEASLSTPMGTSISRSFMNSSVKPTDLEWNDFEKLIDVHSSNQIEAREILDPAFMETIYHWWKDHNKNVRLSFKDNHVYMAIPFWANLFEPKSLSSVDAHKKELWTYLDAIILAEKLFDSIKYKYRM